MNVSQNMNETIINEFFKMVLRTELCDETINVLCVEDKNSNIVMGTNFLSNFFKVKIVYTILSKIDKKLSMQIANIVIKSEPKNGMQLTMVREQNMFIRELTMLKETLPKIEKLVHKQLGPKLWFGSSECRILVMENLSEKGFIMKDRQKGLSMAHCLLVIEQLAKLHAGSVALHEKEPKLIESFKTGGILSATCPESYMRLLEVSLLNMSKAIQGWADQKYNARIATKLDKLAKTIRDRCAVVYKYEPNEFCVLNHGDCWTNNIMFQENDNGKVSNVLMVDYQMSVYSSPAIDLHYFLNICPQTEIKNENDDFLLNLYLKTLTNTMTSIGCTTKAPTMKNLKAALHKRRIYAVFAGVVLAFRMMADVKDTEDFETVLKQLQGETKMDVFKNPDAVILAQKIIPIMDQRHYFD
ncbi:uncharacterized protein LOC114940725 [Nylanderia fulva]|uniref:uncharacterized protein LOC114940725 n=1 Tax=Nylanderia fulva TaxID=613905 RepID=UPI0010FB11EF|nr:uncharacterized protein LOC114940725 [Nylanderia fulva]XP_029171303.1 uncharacterized protein LOC114940725 [Nylanderia fulva]XP_029171304.1 uncharacterized protein LOC114940725 [Nylanderia fulva]XP_029171305.1 uncharacterized protein LOC114940725 [Nylanderia fulva]XP_029171306.1 uncharacterized protein LOC114940725 [Nylanderia fulva]